MLIALLFGVALQAQEFDFSCAPDGDQVTFTTTVGDGLEATHVFDGSETSLTNVIDLNGVVYSGDNGTKLATGIKSTDVGDIGWLVSNFGDGGISVILTLPEGFDYTVGDQVIDLTSELSDNLTYSVPDSVTVRVKFAEGFTHDFIMVDGGGDVSKSVPLPEDWEVLQKIEASGWLEANGDNLAYKVLERAVGSTTVGLILKDLGDFQPSKPFDYTQADFNKDHLADYYEDFIGVPEPDSVTITVQITDDFSYPFTFVDGGDTTIAHTIELPEGKQVVSAITDYGWKKQTATVNRKVDGRAVEATDVGVRLEVRQGFSFDNFSYTQDDFTMDLRSSFSGKIGDIQSYDEIDLGDGEALLGSNHSSSGDAYYLGLTDSRVFNFNYYLQDNTTQRNGAAHNVNNSIKVGEVGSSNVFYKEVDALAAIPEYSSSHSKFNDLRINGGDYDGFVRVATNGSSYTMFAKWSNTTTNHQILIVTTSLDWSGGQINRILDLHGGDKTVDVTVKFATGVEKVVTIASEDTDVGDDIPVTSDNFNGVVHTTFLGQGAQNPSPVTGITNKHSKRDKFSYNM